MGEEVAGSLQIELLPARHGDSILLTWGQEPDLHRLLVDGGPASAYDAVSARMSEVAAAGPLDLLVLTHIDADHIEGAIMLTNDAGVGLEIGEIWFNGPAQLSHELSEAQGEMFSALIGARGIPFNAAFDAGAVRVPDDGPLSVRELEGGLKLTVLGPSSRALTRLRDSWGSVLEDEGLTYGTPEEALQALRSQRRLGVDDPYLAESEPPDADLVGDLARRVAPPDTSVSNASSIVLLAEYDGISLLLSGDATAEALTSGVRRLLAEQGAESVELSAFKVPHHGSTRNITRELLALLPADHYLFSSDGGRHGHPDATCVAKCLEYGKPGAELVFNYRSPQTLLWDDDELLAGAAVRYPEPGSSGVRLALAGRSEH